MAVMENMFMTYLLRVGGLFGGRLQPVLGGFPAEKCSMIVRHFCPSMNVRVTNSIRRSHTCHWEFIVVVTGL